MLASVPSTGALRCLSGAAFVTMTCSPWNTRGVSVQSYVCSCRRHAAGAGEEHCPLNLRRTTLICLVLPSGLGFRHKVEVRTVPGGFVLREQGARYHVIRRSTFVAAILAERGSRGVRGGDAADGPPVEAEGGSAEGRWRHAAVQVFQKAAISLFQGAVGSAESGEGEVGVG